MSNELRYLEICIEKSKVMQLTPFMIERLEDVAKRFRELEESIKPKPSKIAEAIIKWLDTQDDKDKVLFIRKGANSHSFTGEQLIEEINQQTEVGKDIEQNIIALTIDLLFRRKETL